MLKLKEGVRILSTPFKRKEISLLEGYEYQSHFLTPRRHGLRISVTRNTANGEVVVVLVTGNPKRSKKYIEYSKTVLQIPSDSQLQVIVSLLAKNANKIVSEYETSLTK
jgi:hypothetical protein